MDISTLKYEKGGRVPGFSGCLEHTSVITQLISKARINHGDLTADWLDLANAYGSVLHALFTKALPHYHVPDKIQGIIKSYFQNISLRLTAGRFSEARNGNNRLYHLSSFVRDGDESNNQRRRTGNEGSKNINWNKTTF